MKTEVLLDAKELFEEVILDTEPVKFETDADIMCNYKMVQKKYRSNGNNCF